MDTGVLYILNILYVLLDTILVLYLVSSHVSVKKSLCVLEIPLPKPQSVKSRWAHRRTTSCPPFPPNPVERMGVGLGCEGGRGLNEQSSVLSAPMLCDPPSTTCFVRRVPSGPVTRRRPFARGKHTRDRGGAPRPTVTTLDRGPAVRRGRGPVPLSCDLRLAQ